MNFRYKAFDRNKKIISGDIRGNTREEVLKLLQSQNLKVVDLVEKRKIHYEKPHYTFPLEEQAYLFRQISLLLDGGVDLSEILRIFCMDRKKKERAVLKKIRMDIEEGLLFSQAIYNSQAFSPLVHGMIATGESSGELANVLTALSNFYKKEVKLKKKATNALAYPLILLITSFIVTVLIMKYVFPVFLEIFSDNLYNLPLGTKILIALSNHFATYGNIYLLMILTIILIVLILKEFQKYRYKLDTIFLKLPIIGSIFKARIELYFLRTMEIQFHSGVSMIEILENGKNLTKNLVIQEKFTNVMNKVQDGGYIVYSLEQEQLIRPKVANLLKKGEESSQFEDMILIVNEMLEEDFETMLDKLQVYLEPILILLMAFFVGFVVFSIAIPMFDMVNQF